MVEDLRTMLLGGLRGWRPDRPAPTEWIDMAADRGLRTTLDLLRDLPTHYDFISVDTDLQSAKLAARRATTNDGYGAAGADGAKYAAVVSLAGAFVRRVGEGGKASGLLSTEDGPLSIRGLEATVSTGAMFAVGTIRAHYNRGEWAYSIEQPLAWPVDPPRILPRWDDMSRGVCALRMVVTQSLLARMADVAAADSDEFAGVDNFRRITSPTEDEIGWAESLEGRAEVLKWLSWLLGPADPGYDDRAHGGLEASIQSQGVMDRLIAGSDLLCHERSTAPESVHDSTGQQTLPTPRMLKGHAAAEEYAAEVLRALGFSHAKRTPSGADGGVDVTGAGIVAQVKMEALPTGRDRLQALFGIAALEEAQAAFFSLAGYTSQARAWGERAGIALFEFGFDGSVEAVNGVAAALLPPQDA